MNDGGAERRGWMRSRFYVCDVCVEQPDHIRTVQSGSVIKHPSYTPCFSVTRNRPARINNVKWVGSSFDNARRYLIPLVVGVLLAIGIAALAKSTRFDEDRSFYSTVLIIIASYYVLFAVLGGSSQALVWELVIAAAFSTVAILGALFIPALVGIGIIAHGLFDLVHNSIIENSGVPTWWPIFCGSIDVLLGLWVVTITHSRRKVCLSLLIGLSAVTLGACAEEQGKSYWLRHATVTLAQAAQIAETSGPGRAVGAELRQSGTRVFYEIEIIDKVNKTRNIRVDAETGQVIKDLILP